MATAATLPIHLKGSFCRNHGYTGGNGVTLFPRYMKCGKKGGRTGKSVCFNSGNITGIRIPIIFYLIDFMTVILI